MKSETTRGNIHLTTNPKFWWVTPSKISLYQWQHKAYRFAGPGSASGHFELEPDVRVRRDSHTYIVHVRRLEIHIMSGSNSKSKRAKEQMCIV